MKQLLIALTVALSGLTIGLAPLDAEAKRLGGGKAAGMQRQAPPQQPNTPPAQPNNPAPVAGAAAPAAAGATAAAAAGKRSWMGPIAGIAAGLGIAALLSHLGMGEAFANILTMILLAAVAFFVIRWLLRRFAGGQAGAQRARPGDLQFAGAGQGARPAPAAGQPFGMSRSSVESPSAASTGGSSGWAGPAAGAAMAAQPGAGAVSMPPDFDAEAFERVAKMIFIRLQAANDAGQVDDLRKFTTPELFSSLRLDLQERGGTTQQTDVVQLDAQLLDAAQEDGQWIATVRFHGLIREQADAGAEPFDELWHLVKPVDGGREWAIAGISPNTTAATAP